MPGEAPGMHKWNSFESGKRQCIRSDSCSKTCECVNTNFFAYFVLVLSVELLHSLSSGPGATKITLPSLTTQLNRTVPAYSQAVSLAKPQVSVYCKSTLVYLHLTIYRMFTNFFYNAYIDINPFTKVLLFI